MNSEAEFSLSMPQSTTLVQKLLKHISKPEISGLVDVWHFFDKLLKQL